MEIIPPTIEKYATPYNSGNSETTQVMPAILKTALLHLPLKRNNKATDNKTQDSTAVIKGPKFALTKTKGLK